jgi:NTP pyrophosphatase (non-canonical NTP hydrolase)
MDLNELSSTQAEFDKAHGWSLDSEDLTELINLLHRDLVGLLGELGEFANNVKKISLVDDKSNLDETQKFFQELKGNLSEELIDTLIYVIRIATHLGVDLETEYLRKLNLNRAKYQRYEQ